MYVHSVKLINYKSFGNYKENEVIVEPRITAIVGKNESGKSNVLSGLSQIRFKIRNSSAFHQNNVNRSSADRMKNKYLIVLKPTSNDIDLGILSETHIEIAENKYNATGGMLDFYLANLVPIIDELLELLGPLQDNIFKLRDTEWSNYQIYYRDLQNKSTIDVPLKTNSFDFLHKKSEKYSSEKKELLIKKVNLIKDKWTELINTLPVFFYRKSDKHLNTTYKFEDIDKELKNPNSYPNSLLSEFVKAIGITNDDFILAARSGIDPSQESMRRKINRLVNEHINRKFNEFYATEEVFLDVGFNSGIISFVIQSNNGSALMFNERSNGLRWYLETFIDAKSNDIPNRNVVYLLDEPGISLHVNAQKELLNLFEDIADKGNQVIYTTHSPYMLDTNNDGIHHIRAVVKNENGFSYIYKTAYDSRISPESKLDTLTPIINAMGMSLQHTFGPAKEKINIVTEGFSDYIFIYTMAKELNIDPNSYTIIPSTGASNCVNICTILHGWGCKYIALFDYDKAGVESGGEHMRNKLSFAYKKQYCYLLDVSEEDISSCTYKKSPFMIEDLMIRSEIKRFCTEASCCDCNKALTAKLMCNAIETGNFCLSEESKKNFMELFNRLSSYFHS